MTSPLIASELLQTPGETLEHRFQRLRSIWESETAFFSNHQEILGHPAFQEILGMGEEVVPLLLTELAKGPHLWV